MIIDGTNGLTFNNATTQNSGGKVLQVLSFPVNNGTTTSSTTYVATNITGSITPLFSNSKILVFVNTWVAWPNSTGQPVFTIYRGATNLATNFSGSATYGFGGTSTPVNGNYEGMVSANYLDSPATTSSTTYTVYGRADGGGTASYGNSARVSTITLMEIAA